MAEWSARQMVGDRGRRIRRKFSRIRVYKRVGILETAVNQGARHLTDDEIMTMRAK